LKEIRYLRKPTRSYFPAVVFSVEGSIWEKKVSNSGIIIIIIYIHMFKIKLGNQYFLTFEIKKVIVAYTSIEFSTQLRSLFRNILERSFLTKFTE